jgi:hypothetical protein
MWLNAFRYVVKSCKVVQSIVKKNDEVISQKMAEDRESIYQNAMDRSSSYQVRNIEGTKAPLNFPNTIQRQNDIKFEEAKKKKVEMLEQELAEQRQ